MNRHEIRNAFSSELQKFENCYILFNHEIIKENLWVRNGKFCDPEKIFFDEKIEADITWDCNGALISPGYIDVQINGAFGVDFTNLLDDIDENLSKVARGLLQHGVTSFCPTIVSSSKDVYHRILPHIKKKNGSRYGAGILGVHLEGPFISKNKRGAHPVLHIKDFNLGFRDVLDTYGSMENVSLVTLSPEHSNSLQVIEQLQKCGIIVSLGHSEADLEQGEAAVRQGASFITHLFNAMLPFHHRDPHLVGLLTSNKLDNRKVYYGLISDGIHTHPAAMRIAHRVHPKGLILVTDAIQAMGMTEGIHALGSHKIHVQYDKAVVCGTDTLAGSTVAMDKCVRNFYSDTECSKVEALEAASLHPAELLKISNVKGTLNYGSDADFVLLDDKLHVTSTWISGELVWKCNNTHLTSKLK